MNFQLVQSIIKKEYNFAQLLQEKKFVASEYNFVDKVMDYKFVGIEDNLIEQEDLEVIYIVDFEEAKWK